MELVKKSDCRFEDGYILRGDEIIGLPKNVREQLEKLDLVWQMFGYVSEQEPGRPAPSLKGFHRVTAREDNRKWSLLDEPETPTMDARVKETVAFLREREEKGDVEMVNNVAMEKFSELLDFCECDKFIPCGHWMSDPIDCVSLGNPLTLTADGVLEMLLAIRQDDNAELSEIGIGFPM